jgi:hypothetical protein
MRLPGSLREWSIVVAALAFGCTPNIGDDCKLHTDCSATGDRICEPNLPGGYCTIFNCEPYGCPDDATCVAFGATPSTQPECANQQAQRLERTFCMKPCSSNGDCRSGYACVQINDPKHPDQPKNAWGAVVLDPNRGTRICMVPLSSDALNATLKASMSMSEDVCRPLPPLDGSVLPPFDAGRPVTDARSAGDGAPAPRPDAARRDSAVRPDAGLGAPDAQGTP